MAYAAVISLKQTIHRLLNSSRIWIGYSSRQILQSAYEEATSLQEVLQKFNDGRFRSSWRLDAVDGEIRDAVREVEDVLHQSTDLYLGASREEGFPQMFSLDEHDDQIRRSFADAAKKMKEDYMEELDNALLKQEDDGVSSSSIDFGVEMVGFSDELASLRKHVLKPKRPLDFVVFSIIGRAGTGRTILGKKLSEDVCKYELLECGAWVSVGRKYELKHILASILAQVDDDDDPTSVADDDEEQNIGEYLHGCLRGRRYLIVLDDVWDARLWDLLRGWFPEQNNGSAVLLTTSLEEVALSADSFYIHKMLNYGNEQSWHMILEWLNDDELIITPEMEEAGRKIAKNCGGLLLAITRVGCLLAAAEKTPEYWKKVAADEHNPIFTVVDELSEVSEVNEAAKNWSICHRDSSGNEYFDCSRYVGMVLVKMFPRRSYPYTETIAVLGMAGIGKTTLAKKIFGDPFILCHFDHRVWLTLGPKCESKEILVDILAQIYPNMDRGQIKGSRKLSKLRGRLSSKRCLIVLDDVWTIEPLHYLQRVLDKVHAKVLLTTRLAKLGQIEHYNIVQQVCLLSKKESWQLFCQKVFVDGSCPPKLEKAGKKISEDCEGLPLLILTVADILSKVEKTPEYWNKVAVNQTSVFMEAYHKLSGVLLPSYQGLHQHLKACFLYMGVFPQKYEISTKKLINYWTVEGLLESYVSQNVQDFASGRLKEIADKSLIMVLHRGSYLGIKTSALHCVFWYLSNCEAAKIKFFHAMTKRSDCVVEDTKAQHRLCIRNNVLFAINNVRAYLASFSTARSLLCTGPRHQYPVPMCFDLRLLQVLSALTIRFYDSSPLKQWN